MLMREALKSTLFSKFMGKSKRSIIQRLTELEKNAGDEIKYDLLMQMTGAGITGDNRMKSNEEALVYYQDQINIDQLRNAHAFRRLSSQRTLHDLRADARDNLADWWAGTLDQYMMDYLCGNTTRNHGQAALAPDSDHYIVCGDVSHSGTIATDESSLGSNDQVDLMDIDYAKEKARTITPMIRPTIIDGEEFYVVVLHEYSITDLKTQANTSAQIKWSEIQRYANVRGLKNPIFSGSHGVYNKCIIFDSTRIYNPTGSVRRNLFLGAQAGVFAVGNAYDKISQRKVGSKNLMSWYEEIDDYGNEKGVAAGMIFAVKACRFNSKNYGAMVISAYAASH
jgi:N4-gp56 family major capsid protein